MKLIRKIISKIKKENRDKFRACGENIKIFGTPYIVAGKNISLGNAVNLNHGAILNATDSEIIIGDNVTISSNAMLMAASYDVKNFLLNEGGGKRKHTPNKIVVGNNVWICAGAIVLPGVTISDSVIVAAGSVVTKDIEESYVLVAGNPARVVKKYV